MIILRFFELDFCFYWLELGDFVVLGIFFVNLVLVLKFFLCKSWRVILGRIR